MIMNREKQSPQQQREQPQCQQRRHRGIIHFRSIEPSDRCAIQKLHELWFPVDYTPEFFDMLCCGSTTTTIGSSSSTRKEIGNGYTTINHDQENSHNDERREPKHQKQKQQHHHHHQKYKRIPPKMNSFYTCVACYRELNDEEYEKYQLISMQKQRMPRWKNKIEDTHSYFYGGGGSDDYDDDDDWDDCEHNIDDDRVNSGGEYYDDFILWESDDCSIPPKVRNIHDESDGQDTRIGCMHRWRRNSHQSGTTSSKTVIMDNSDDDYDDDDDDDDDENNIENGKSNSSIYRRAERERMKRFYENGCVDNNGNLDHDHYGMLPSGNGGTSEATQPCYNEKGERIIGCIIGSFLPSSSLSTMRQKQHSPSSSSSSLKDKLNVYINQEQHCPPPPSSSSPRDETAALLIPDPSVHRSMFYIMTLGTCQEFRRCGLGSLLVDRVVDMIQSQGQSRPQQQHHQQQQQYPWAQHPQQSISSMSSSKDDEKRRMSSRNCVRNQEKEELDVGCCGALYLHVITYNKGAIRMYERLGFMRVKKIDDYYTINSVNYACYLYARYFHGNRGHRTMSDIMYEKAASFLRNLLW